MTVYLNYGDSLLKYEFNTNYGDSLLKYEFNTDNLAIDSTYEVK